MIRCLLITCLSLAALAAEDRLWVGIYTSETGEGGKAQNFYVMGRIAAEDLAALREGKLRDGFVTLSEVCWKEQDEEGKDRITANAASDGNAEESDIVLFRAIRIERVAQLKGDPRTLLTKPAAGSAKPATTEGY